MKQFAASLTGNQLLKIDIFWLNDEYVWYIDTPGRILRAASPVDMDMDMVSYHHYNHYDH